METNSNSKDPGELTGARYWKSLDDLAETPAFREWLEREFPQGASEIDGVNRRNFMKVMAASFGLAGLGMAGCRRPKQFIKPYSKQPERIIPGVPVFYSTSMPGARDSLPLVVETHQARPTKIEGNPSFLPYGGSTDTFAQASVLDLYDPDRVTRSRIDGARVDNAKVFDELTSISRAHELDAGKGLVFLAEPSTSPSRRRLVAALKKKFPGVFWAEYSPVEYNHAENAAAAVFGRPVRTLPRLEKAKCILSIDADFVNCGSGKLANARGFAKGRRVLNADEAKDMSRLYSVEANLTNTGSMADHRLRLSTGQMGAFAALIGAAILDEKGAAGGLSGKLKQAGEGLHVDGKWVRECAKDLVAHAGKHQSLVVAGDHLPESVHAIVLAINEVLGAPKHTVDYVGLPAGPENGIRELAARLRSGAAKTLVILGGNPCYDAPADLNWPALQGEVRQTVHLTYHANETSLASDVVIARPHYLESWGDGRTFDGTLVPVQPMIEPLFQSVNELEVLARLAGLEEVDPNKIVRETYALEGGTSFDGFLSQGVHKDSAFKPVAAGSVLSGVEGFLKPAELAPSHPGEDALEVFFTPSSHSYDGRYVNNGWLMETPDPLTKLTWDNAILISPRLAKDVETSQGIKIFPDHTILTSSDSLFKGVRGEQQRNSATFKRGKEEAPVATLTVNGREVTGPVHVHPGLANYTVVLPLGFGRSEAGRVGKNAGFNAYSVRTSDTMALAGNATLKFTRERYRLANTQEHWSMEGRAIIREATVSDFKKHPDFADKMGIEAHSPPIYGKDQDKPLHYKATRQPRGNSAHETPRFTAPPKNVGIWRGEENEKKFKAPQQWGMAIDLNTCTGCNACVVACTSENNIPVIGKDQVLRGREMHWIRIDRYFSSAENDNGEVPEDVQVSFMGMACQHCENAPCESVCPVNATVHDEQGLNVMAYNRCVGTRYCANNCPYKVRRFNFFDWNKRKDGSYYMGPLGPADKSDLSKMNRNPNVSVRMLGVMEKCTYCVQRIEAAKIDQKAKARNSADIYVPDGRIKTACQQVCPTEAIAFGDISDTETEVYKIKQSDRDYTVLGYLNNRPRTTYLARLRNPNKAMPTYYEQPYTRQAYESRYGHGAGRGGRESNHGDGKHPEPAAHGDPQH